MISRRTLIQGLPMAAAAAALTGVPVRAADLPLVSEQDAQALALGYVADAAKVNKAKYPKYAAGQACSNCALYQGKPGEASAVCPLFAAKQVAGKGWCSAYAKKS